MDSLRADTDIMTGRSRSQPDRASSRQPLPQARSLQQIQGHPQHGVLVPWLHRLAALQQREVAPDRQSQGQVTPAGAPHVGAHQGLERHPQECHAEAHRGQL